MLYEVITVQAGAVQAGPGAGAARPVLQRRHGPAANLARADPLHAQLHPPDHAVRLGRQLGRAAARLRHARRGRHPQPAHVPGGPVVYGQSLV